MGRIYKVTFENVTTSAAQDLVAAYGASGKMCKLRRVWAECYTATPTSQNLGYRVRFLPATVTPGTGGGAATPQKTDQGDASATFTARINDTSKATTTGTASIFEEGAAHILAGYDKSFEAPLTFGASTAVVFELLSTPSGSVALSGGVEVEEIG